MTNSLTLKWGTVKAWNVESEDGMAALRKWASYGVCESAMLQKREPEQQQALLELIDHMDEIYLDWEGKSVTRPALEHSELTEQLADALEGLLMEQNGPPLERRATLWHRAINEAKEVLGKYEEIKQ